MCWNLVLEAIVGLPVGVGGGVLGYAAFEIGILLPSASGDTTWGLILSAGAV